MTKQLDQKADAFCIHYTAIGTESFGRAEKSAQAAGYAGKGAKNVATRLLRRPAVQQRIAELHQANMVRNGITVDKVLSDLENLRIRAEDRGDLSTAFRCSEAECKFLSLFTDRVELVGPAERRELDEREQAECRQIALIRLKMQLSGQGVGEGGAVALLEGGELSPVFTPSFSLQAESQGEKTPGRPPLSPPTGGGVELHLPTSGCN